MSDGRRRAVLIVSRVYRGGGAERQAALLAQNLAGEGYEVSILSFKVEDQDRPPPGVRLLRASEVAVSEGFHRRFVAVHVGRMLSPLVLHVLHLAAGFRRVRHTRGLSRIIDAVVVRVALLTFAGAGRTIRAAVQQTGASTVIAFLPSMYGAATAGLWSAPVRLIASDRSDPSRPVVKAHWRAMQHLVARRADVFGANTAAASRWIVEQHGPDRHDGPVLTPNILEAMPSAVAPDSRRFIAVSRLVGGKGVDRLIDAFAMLSAELSEWRLVIAGDGAARAELERRVTSAGVAERCEFLGEVEVGSVLEGGGILVHPSDLEGTPNAVMEAMAYGLPCIVTDSSPGPIELVLGRLSGSNDRAALTPSGIVVTAGDVEALAAGMRELAESSGYRESLARAARVRAGELLWAARREAWLGLVDGPTDGLAAFRQEEERPASSG